MFIARVCVGLMEYEKAHNVAEENETRLLVLCEPIESNITLRMTEWSFYSL